MDEVLYSIAEDVKNYCVIYLVDIKEVPDFNALYELYDPVTVMFFYRCGGSVVLYVWESLLDSWWRISRKIQ